MFSTSLVFTSHGLPFLSMPPEIAHTFSMWMGCGSPSMAVLFPSCFDAEPSKPWHIHKRKDQARNLLIQDVHNAPCNFCNASSALPNISRARIHPCPWSSEPTCSARLENTDASLCDAFLTICIYIYIHYILRRNIYIFIRPCTGINADLNL